MKQQCSVFIPRKFDTEIWNPKISQDDKKPVVKITDMGLKSDQRKLLCNLSAENKSEPEMNEDWEL